MLMQDLGGLRFCDMKQPEYAQGGYYMANVDLWGTVIMLRYLQQQGKITGKEANQILKRIACETGADLIISL